MRMDSSEALDYAGFLAKLLELQGEQVDLGVRGAESGSPLYVYCGGQLSSNEIYGGDLVGYDADTFGVKVGTASVTIHPDQFRGGLWIQDDRMRSLVGGFGSVELTFRAGL